MPSFDIVNSNIDHCKGMLTRRLQQWQALKMSRGKSRFSEGERQTDEAVATS